MGGSELSGTLGIVLILYVVAMFGVSLWARGRIENSADFLVAGRRLPLGLSWATLFATWFGAGTLLTATDEVRADGMTKAALDPFGAGFCLILAGLFFAKKLWNMELLTVADFFRRRFGPRAELLSSILMIPGYTGWIAAQFVALAGVLQLFFGIPLSWGILLVAAVGTGYTLLGGMWSVTLTDAVQMALLIIGIVLLTFSTFSALGNGDVLAGHARLVAESPPQMLTVIPTERMNDLVLWLGVFCAGALGNIPGQDLMQRVFASKTARTAQWACLLAGAAYLVIGVLPLMTGLAGNLLFPGQADVSILPFLAQKLLHPASAVIFLLAVSSAVLSTIDSAILSPASVLSQNILSRLKQDRFSALQLSHIAVVVVALASLLLAYVGEDAYSLLEAAYELGLVSLLVPLTLGLYGTMRSEWAALASMSGGTLVWVVHLIMGWDFFLQPLFAFIPAGIGSAAVGLLVFLIVGRVES